MRVPQSIPAFVIMVAVCCSVTACRPRELPPDAKLIRGAGATFPAPLYKKWIGQYAALHPDVVVDYEAVGSGEGTKRFLAGEVDFGASDAALSDEQMARVDRGVQLVPTTAGSIALAYNLPELGGELRLSREVYVDIFLNEITRWDDARIKKLNPELNLPNKAIAVVARRDSSGTTYAFTNHLSAISDHWRDRGPGTGKLIDWPGPTMLANGNEGVAGVIKRTAGAIGYVEYGIAARGGLSLARLENRAGKFVAPTGSSGMATLANADLPENLRAFFPDPAGEDSYPIVTYTWILLYRQYEEPELADRVKAFLRWCLTDGQQYNEELGFIELPPEVAAAAVEAVERIPGG
jgi:phosphate transport system substrate-binding protein